MASAADQFEDRLLRGGPEKTRGAAAGFKTAITRRETPPSAGFDDQRSGFATSV
jgi:hypothetical protein